MPPPPLSVEEALARVLNGATSLGEEHMPLRGANRRILARDLSALRTQPPFDNAAMDGYAIASGAPVGTPFKLIGESAAGNPFDGVLGNGETIRIFTGAAIPAGADCVVAQEDACREGGTVTFAVAPNAGRFVRRAGLDFHAGEMLLAAGTRLRPADIALAAAMGHAELPLARPPRVGVLATGDELARPGDPGGDVVASNLDGLLALVADTGGEPVDLGIARDTSDDLLKALHRAQDERLDVLVSSGGASVGDHDLVRPVFVEAGLALDVWKIAMRPGRPMIAGRFGAMRFIGLPGNPVSAMVCGTLFLAPLLRALQGMPDPAPPIETASLAAPMPPNDARQDYVRARLTDDVRHGRCAAPFPVQDSSVLRTASAADCLIVRAPHAPAAQAGDLVAIIRLRP